MTYYCKRAVLVGDNRRYNGFVDSFSGNCWEWTSAGMGWLRVLGGIEGCRLNINILDLCNAETLVYNVRLLDHAHFLGRWDEVHQL